MFLRTVRKEICSKSGSARSSSVLYSSNSSGMGRHNSYPSFMQSVCTPGNSFAESIRSKQKLRKSTRGGFAWGCRKSKFNRRRRLPGCLQTRISFINSSCLSYSHPDRISDRIALLSVLGSLVHKIISHGYPLCGCGQIISLLNPFTTLNLISFDLLCRKVIVFLANFL